MGAVGILLISLAGIVLGYFRYAKTIDRSVLFEYQFKSVAALGPIVGPIAAVRWGLLPALL